MVIAFEHGPAGKCTRYDKGEQQRRYNNEANNTFNPIWVKSLNKNGDIPSGVQLSDLLDKIREEAFAVKDAQRRIYLVASRKRTAQKKLLKNLVIVDKLSVLGFIVIMRMASTVSLIDPIPANQNF